MRVLTGIGLTLEPQVAGHAGEMFALLADPELYRYMDDPPPESPGWLRDRFVRLESRRSADGTEQWLNWVIRLPNGPLAGYVQATVYAAGCADIAYVLGPTHQGQGIARTAVGTMIEELIATYAVGTLSAVVARANVRSRHLLHHLGFTEAPGEAKARRRIADDDELYWRAAVPRRAGGPDHIGGVPT